MKDDVQNMIKNKYAIYKRSKHNEGVSTQDRVLRLLYGNRAGRMVLGWLIRPEVSKLVGRFMDTGLSRIMINPFIKKNDIDISVCQKNEFDSYNDFFKRKLVPGTRVVDMTDEGFVSPCDSRLTVYDIEDTERQTFNIKDSEYTVASLLRDKKLARHYRGGKLWLFRLCVDDYHRYIYNVSGKQSDVRRIEGLYHTVNPIASEYYDIYKENTREYCLIRTEDAGTVVDMEVGALLVGRIVNRCVDSTDVRRGEEKGYFEFGGSTIILLTQKDKVTPLGRIVENSRKDIETRVRQGELVGYVS